jgi:hypothetical protein
VFNEQATSSLMSVNSHSSATNIQLSTGLWYAILSVFHECNPCGLQGIFILQGVDENEV